MNLCDIRTIRQIMDIYGLHFRKEFGQNFLTNNMVVEDIAEFCCEGRSKTILEIGPGIGVLTKELCLRYPNVVALEIDKGLMPVLQYTLNEFTNVKVHNQDVMEADLDSLLSPYLQFGGVSVCANLPYYITTPILMKLLESRFPFEYITVMVQSEVADRLCAKAGSKAYGAITASIGYYGEAERLFVVPAQDFMPAPKVNSAVVRIRLYGDKKPYVPKNESLFFRTIKVAFEQRRKTLANALSAGFGELTKEQIQQIIAQCGHSADIRGERLSVSEFVVLSDAIGQAIG
jgi:16S rRNA (adenine1518-N6/adenine1519-N6)-dimethyltransferase